MKNNKNIWFCTLCVFGLYLYANSVADGRSLIVSVLLEFLLLLLYSIKNTPKTYVLMFFLASFFTFLLGRDCAFLFFPQWQDVFAVYSIDYSEQIVKYNCLYLALLAIFIGFTWSKDKFKEIDLIEKDIVLWRNDRLSHIALNIFYISLTFRVLQIITSQTIISGVYAAMDNIASSPIFIRILGFVNTGSFVLFLCTNPSKKILKWPLFLFIVLTIASILDGVRGPVVTKLLFVLIYLVSRDYGKDAHERFLTRRAICCLWIIGPLFLVTLNLFAMVRSKNQVISNGFIMDTIGFFVQQGGSSNLITLADKNRYILPSGNTYYIFGPYVLYKDRFTKQNLDAEQRLTENAQYGNNLGAALTYTLDRAYYYQGGGYGTVYIAELYVDFGYIGILVYNILLGVLLRYLSFDVRKKLWLRILSCFAIIIILFLPRDFALSLVTLFTPSYIGVLFLVVLLQKIVEKQYKRHQCCDILLNDHCVIKNH